ncbi:3'-5' exonuclease [Erythrobacter sp. MTPC3]|uniref:3'-5' exonuclease n=1 Tax=Erythrobacter sp. MTPC3 TaxID=3056564 RepID=UPI0036F1F1C9
MNTQDTPVSQEAGDSACAAADTRILRRITRLDDWPVIARQSEPTTLIAVLDVETEGLDPDDCQVLEIAVALVRVDAEGRIVTIVDKAYGLQDPGRPLAAAIMKITGLTDEKLAGKAIDIPKVTQVIARAEAVVAHNASFDSGFCRRLLPGIERLPWVCSHKDVDWIEHGYDGAKLGHLIMQQGMFVPKAHSAGDDVTALVNLLASALPNGRTVVGEVLDNARSQTVRVEAKDVPPKDKGEVKRRGYRFDWTTKVWWIETSQFQADYERSWLERHFPRVRVTCVPLDWHNRHIR